MICSQCLLNNRLEIPECEEVPIIAKVYFDEGLALSKY